MSFYVVQRKFVGSDFTLAGVCPSGARINRFYVSKEGAEEIAATLTKILGEDWEAKEASE